jgi:hypothetical protein
MRPVPVPGSCIGGPAEVHLHFHGVTAEEVAAIIEHERR